MADGNIELTLVTPEKAVAREQVQELQIPGAAGYFGVLPGHAPLFSELKPGEVGSRIGNRWYFLAVSGGFVEVLPDQVRLLVETAERPEEIDLARAERAKQRAEERIAKGGPDLDYDRAIAALERAMVRMAVTRKTSSAA
jgi:F-type H+-transporting ATPase subunit epsilon